MDDPIWSPTTFSKNRDRLLAQDVAGAFFDGVLAQARAAGLLSDEHFTVDGTLLEAWASLKSFRRKDGTGGDGAGRDFRGQSRTNDTHASTTDPDAQALPQIERDGVAPRLSRPSADRESALADRGCRATQADGTAEREAATVLLAAQADRAPGRHRTVGADKAYDTADFVDWTRALGVTPYVTQNLARRGGSAIDGRTTRHVGYAQRQHVRPRVEPAFGWLKSIAWMRKVKLRGLAKVDWLFVFASAAFNLIRLPKLLPASA